MACFQPGRVTAPAGSRQPVAIGWGSASGVGALGRGIAPDKNVFIGRAADKGVWMGLGFHTTAKPAFSLYPGRPDREKTLTGIVQAAAQYVSSDYWLSRFGSIKRHETEVHVQLHPVGGAVHISIANDGSVTASAQTSIAGPGFHASAIDLLNHIHTRTGLYWEWDDADTTGYAGERNYYKLRERMAAWARRELLEASQEMRADTTPIGLNLDPHLPMHDLPCHFITPMGPWNFASVRDVMQGPEPAALELAAGLFPWWDQKPSAHDLRNTAIALMWTGLPWRPACDEAEFRTMKLADECLEAAQSKGIDRKLLPIREMTELKTHLAAGIIPVTHAPRSEGIGYRRHYCTWQLGHAWTIQLPGWWHRRLSDAGDAVVLSYQDKQLHCIAIEFEPRPGLPSTPEAVLESSLRISSGPNGHRVRFSCDRLPGHATISPSHTRPGFCEATVKVADRNGMLIMTGYFARRDDTEWLAKALATIRHQTSRSELPQLV
jgi:hypothetical protein